MLKFKVQYDLNLTEAERLSRYGLRRAMRIGVNRAAAKVKASEISQAEQIRLFGYTARSIRIKVKVYPSDRYVAIVGTGSGVKFTRGKFTRGKRKGEKRVIRPAKYAWLVIKGTKHARPAFNWLNAALNESGGTYQADVVESVRIEIEKELSRQSAK